MVVTRQKVNRCPAQKRSYHLTLRQGNLQSPGRNRGNDSDCALSHCDHDGDLRRVRGLWLLPGWRRAAPARHCGMGPVMTDVVAPLGGGLLLKAPFKNSISRACL